MGNPDDHRAARKYHQIHSLRFQVGEDFIIQPDGLHHCSQLVIGCHFSSCEPSWREQGFVMHENARHQHFKDVGWGSVSNGIPTRLPNGSEWMNTPHPSALSLWIHYHPFINSAYQPVNRWPVGVMCWCYMELVKLVTTSVSWRSCNPSCFGRCLFWAGLKNMAPPNPMVYDHLSEFAQNFWGQIPHV